MIPSEWKRDYNNWIYFLFLFLYFNWSQLLLLIIGKYLVVLILIRVNIIFEKKKYTCKSWKLKTRKLFKTESPCSFWAKRVVSPFRIIVCWPNSTSHSCRLGPTVVCNGPAAWHSNGWARTRIIEMDRPRTFN